MDAKRAIQIMEDHCIGHTEEEIDQAIALLKNITNVMIKLVNDEDGFVDLNFGVDNKCYIDCCVEINDSERKTIKELENIDYE